MVGASNMRFPLRSGQRAFIYISGGAESPVVAFYIMTFTLTLSNARRRTAWLEIGSLFLLVLAIVFALDRDLLAPYLNAPHPIDKVTFATMRQSDSDAYYYAVAAGLAYLS